MSTDTDVMETLSPEQSEFMAKVNLAEQNIGGAAVHHDGQGNIVEPAAAPEPDDPCAENIAILRAVIAMLTPAMPFLAQAYPDKTIESIGTAYTAVEEKHGWNARQYLTVEAQLAIVAIPPTIAAVYLGRIYFRDLVVEKKAPWWLKWWYRRRKVQPAPEAQGGEGGDGSRE